MPTIGQQTVGDIQRRRGLASQASPRPAAVAATSSAVAGGGDRIGFGLSSTSAGPAAHRAHRRHRADHRPARRTEPAPPGRHPAEHGDGQAQRCGGTPPIKRRLQSSAIESRPRASSASQRDRQQARSGRGWLMGAAPMAARSLSRPARCLRRIAGSEMYPGDQGIGGNRQLFAERSRSRAQSSPCREQLRRQPWHKRRRRSSDGSAELTQQGEQPSALVVARTPGTQRGPVCPARR